MWIWSSAHMQTTMDTTVQNVLNGYGTSMTTAEAWACEFGNSLVHTGKDILVDNGRKAVEGLFVGKASSAMRLRFRLPSSL